MSYKALQWRLDRGNDRKVLDHKKVKFNCVWLILLTLVQYKNYLPFCLRKANAK